MVIRENRENRTIRFTDSEWKRLEVIAKSIGFDDRASFIRFNMMNIVKEEEMQK